MEAGLTVSRNNIMATIHSVRAHPLGIALDAARAQTDKLFTLIRPDYLYERPIPERHRLIFYLGHVEAFDWNQMARWALSATSFHPAFDKLFEAGIDPPLGQAASDRPSDWPGVAEILAYRERVRETLRDLLPQVPDSLVHTAIEHRLMHAETLAYLLHELPYEGKNAPALGPDLSVQGSAGTSPVDIPAGYATLGQRRGAGFGWDNEFEEHQVRVSGFSIDRHKVTNGDYLEFVRQGGTPPHFWVDVKGNWFYRGFFFRIPLTHDWPVYVTHEQATAYATWRKKRLPTEAEFHRAAYGTRAGTENPFPWGFHSGGASRGNFDFQRWDPVSVYATPAGDSAYGAAQLCGNGWEWTSSPFLPFEGFAPEKNYPGYSANFFDRQHYVLKGASPRTAACFLRRSYRNWFRPNYPYIYATFRCVES